MSYDIRQSQVIHTWPSGSMIDFPEISLVMLCHDDGYRKDDWGIEDQQNPNKKEIIEDNRLAEAFKVSHFIVPPQLDGINSLSVYGVRFPGALYCSKCGLIHFTTKSMGTQLKSNSTYDHKMSAFTCDVCTNNQTGIGPKLIPMRFVIATEEGFVADFPWDWFVHKTCPNERGKGHKLYYKSKGGSAGLSDITIESFRKNDNKSVAKRDLGQIFDQSIFVETGDNGQHYLDYVKGFLPKPWKGWHNNESYISELVGDIPSHGRLREGDDLSPIAKRKFPRTMQRGAGNIIFPIVYSGMLLPKTTYEQQCPPRVQEIVEQTITALKENIPDTYENYNNDEWRNFLIDSVQNKPNHRLLSLEYNQAQIIGFIKNYFGENSQERFINKASLLRLQEFRAFTGNVMHDDTVWFTKKICEGFRYNELIKQQGLLENVVLLEKLSALKVYKGFTRVKPLMGEELVFAEAEDNLDENQRYEFERIQDARRNPVHTRELPAIEVKGEGIFLKFNNATLNEWATNYPDQRLTTINNNLKQANLNFSQDHQLINKRYLFLHTLSHILLKELAEDCGYSLSSLAEIIYCSSDIMAGTEEEMNGILIYTVTADSEGSLGGLVEKGRPEYLSSVIKKGVDKARWCSSDPLCISAEHGQGFMGLNLAACYSCVLLPETSCEKMNKFLDRASVIGTLNTPGIGLFNK